VHRGGGQRLRRLMKKWKGSDDDFASCAEMMMMSAARKLLRTINNKSCLVGFSGHLIDSIMLLLSRGRVSFFRRNIITLCYIHIPP
jgi:hypothetical protein